MTEPNQLPPLSDMDVAARADRVRRVLGDAGCDALLVTKASNVRWLTGFTGSNGQVLVTADELLVRHRWSLSGADPLGARTLRGRSQH